MVLPKIKVITRQRNNTASIVLIDGEKIKLSHPDDHCRKVLLYNDFVIKFNDYADFNQNSREYTRWLGLTNHPQFRLDKKYFAEILYVSGDYDYIIQRRYSFRPQTHVSIKEKSFHYTIVERLMKKYDIGGDFDICCHNWGITQNDNSLKIYDLGAL